MIIVILFKIVICFFLFVFLFVPGVSVLSGVVAKVVVGNINSYFSLSLM